MTYEDYMREEMGYECITTYWSDFSIAERFGPKAIQDTFNRATKLDGDYKSLTELSLVLNHKIWQHYGKDNKVAELYDKLWRKLDSALVDTLKGEQLSYYMRTTD